MYKLLLIKDDEIELLGVYDNIDSLILGWLLIHQHKDGSFWINNDLWNGFCMKLHKMNEE